MQLDIFDDSRDTQLRNALAEALLRQDPAAAAAVRGVLAREFPQDPCAALAATLIDCLAQGEAAAFSRHDEALQAQRLLLEQIEPAARCVLGEAAAGDWLAARWAALAQRAAGLSFDRQHDGVHAAPCWLRARQWEAAAAAVGRIASWRRIPQPLAWMVQARHAQQGLDAVWDLLAELAWLAPHRLDTLMREVSDPLLDRLRERFETSIDGDGTVDELAWFPAWLLTERPSLAGRLALAQRGTCSPAERGLRLLAELLGLERQGRQRDMGARRKELRDLHRGLFAAYMASR